MKTKFFLAALAALAFVGCNKELNNTELPEVNDESALLQVNVKAAGTMTKADSDDADYPGDYVKGDATENAVAKVDFYFFDANGAAYQVATTGENVITWTDGTVENVEKVSDVILVIKKTKKALPTHVVAVVNSTVNYKDLSLAALASEVTALRSDNGFVMSNSVYVDANGAKIVATKILPENIFTTTALDNVEPGQAITGGKFTEGGETITVNPVDIYVERVAAKVKVTLPNVTDDLIPVKDEQGNPMLDAEGKAVFAKVLGWNITNCTDQAYLIKSVDATWTDAEVGFAWNDMSYFRSYWAKTTDTPVHPYSYNDLLKHNVTSDYYYENTLPAATENSVVSGEGNQTPQLLVAAKLVHNDENKTAVSLAKWYNVFYTVAGLKTAMVNNLAAKLYVKKDATTYVSVGINDVVFEQVPENTADKRYEVKVLPKKGVEYYTISGDDPIAITGDNLNAVFADLAPAMMWETGMTYYHTNIKHFGTATGIVRNHVYDITVNGVMGFGTPVYNPDLKITPEDPDEQPAANLAAQINILSWSVVSQDITLQ